MLQQINAMICAEKLVRAGARTSVIVSVLDNIDDRCVRSLHWSVHAEPSRRGRGPTDAKAYLTPRINNAQSSLLLSIYRLLKTQSTSPPAELLLSAFNIYQSFATPAIFDINRLWLLEQLYVDGEIILGECPSCAAPYLIKPGAKFRKCHICSTKPRVTKRTVESDSKNSGAVS